MLSRLLSSILGNETATASLRDPGALFATGNSALTLNSKYQSKPQSWETLVHFGPYFRDYYNFANVDEFVVVNAQTKTFLPLTNEQKYFLRELLSVTYSKLKQDGDEKTISYNDIRDLKKVWGTAFLRNFLTDFNTIGNTKISLDELSQLDMRNAFDLFVQGRFSFKLNQAEENKYRFAVLNNQEVAILNPVMERPRIFFGKDRDSRNNGKLRRQMRREDVEINISKAQAPEEIKRFKWKRVLEDHNMFWTAHWRDPITKKQKYIWLDHTSEHKQQVELDKFNFAYNLSSDIKRIRAIYLNEAKNGKTVQNKQIGTCIYLIDNLGLRLGTSNEITINDPEKDALGVVQLRVFNFKFLPNNQIVIDFFGKDKIKYNKKVTVPDVIYQNLRDFVKNKENYQKIFDQINSSIINGYLQELKPGLTSKILRTFRSSYEFQKKINEIDFSTDPAIVAMQIKLALLQIAKITNHVVIKNEKKVSKMLDKLYEKQVQQKGNPTQRKLTELKIAFIEESANTGIPGYYFQINTLVQAYIDPRIYLSKLNLHNINFSFFLSRTELKKFQWAIKFIQKYPNFSYPTKLP